MTENYRGADAQIDSALAVEVKKQAEAVMRELLINKEK